MNLEKHADELWAAYIRARDIICVLYNQDRGACWGPLDAHHLLRRSFKAVRWEPDNGVALCRGHHEWLHNHPLVHVDWRSQRLGPRFQELCLQAYSRVRPDMEQVLKRLAA